MKKRVLYYDVLNTFATFCVVLLHTNGLSHHYSETAAWYQAFAVEVLFYWPVPIFFMLSGATLMGYRDRYSTEVFLKKRFMRTVIPFIAWSVISAAIAKINPMEIGFTAFINQVFNTTIQGVYWFFIPLFAIYLALPALSLLKNNRRILWYMAFCSFLLSCFLPNICGYIGINYNGALDFPMVSGYMIFVIIGYLLSTREFKLWQRLAIYLLGIVGIAVRFFGTVLHSRAIGELYEGYFYYKGYYSIFLAVAVFVFFKQSRTIKRLEENKTVCKILGTVSGCSFGIYLTHMLVYRALALVMPTDTYVWRLAVPFLIYTICLVCTFLMKKMPIIKHIVP